MNKRHEPISSQEGKKVRKEVKRGLTGTTTIAVKPGKKVAKPKNPSTRQRGPVGATPACTTKEGSRWAEVLRKQTEENELRMKVHSQKQ
ncbi:MAG: hypothetical protein FJZ58_04630 [Chlamydiae bacterium]|nr:hypothetical protein [Chlamydiota bacterium]